MQGNKEQLRGSKPWAAAKLGWVGLICGGLGLAAVVGYLLGTAGQKETSMLAVQQRVPFEFYLNEDSFSEIENTKAKLEALAVEFLTDLRLRHDGSILGPAASEHKNPSYAVQAEKARAELQNGIQQFKGTEQEMSLTQELLLLLKRQKLLDRWMDVYLGALYAHPTDALIGRYAKDAVTIGEAVGRQEDLMNAFDVLRRRIPLDFPAKEQVLAGLGQRLAQPLERHWAAHVAQDPSLGFIQQVRQ